MVAPIIDNILLEISKKQQRIVCVILAVIFLSDFTYSQFHPNTGKGITDYTASAEYSQQTEKTGELS